MRKSKSDRTVTVSIMRPDGTTALVPMSNKQWALVREAIDSHHAYLLDIGYDDDAAELGAARHSLNNAAGVGRVQHD